MSNVNWGLVLKVVVIAAVVAWLLLVVVPDRRHANPNCPPSSFPENC